MDAPVKQALILAGGLGTRLGDLARVTPKPMLPAGPRPLLEHIVWNLARHGVRDLVLSVGHLADRVTEHFGNGERFGVRVRYVHEREPLGTGGAVREAAPVLDDAFLVLNGDTILDVNYLALGNALRRPGALAAIALRDVSDVQRYGSVVIDRDRIVAFGEKARPGPGVVSGGVYAMRREALEWLPRGRSSLEEDLFPRLAAAGAAVALRAHGFFIDIGVPDALRDAQTLVPAWRHKPAVFLDRDGTLNEDRGYVHRAADFAWIDGAVDAVRWLNDRGYLVIVVTNQAGIARGLYSEADFHRFTAWIDARLRDAGAHVDATYYCPHHPDFGDATYRQVCECRKPAPGLFVRAIREWNVDVPSSFAVGDKASDVAAARAAGVRAAFFTGGNLREFLEWRLGGVLATPRAARGSA